MEFSEIEGKIVYLKGMLKELEENYNDYNQKNIDLKLKRKTYLAISKLVEEIVESGIKINNLVLEKKKDYAPSYYESFSKLSKYYEIEEDFIKKIAKTSAFRNKIVHTYSEMEDLDIISNVEPILYLYEKYIKLINKILKIEKN